MSDFFTLDWRTLFQLHTPLLEIFVRGSCVYLALFIMLRLILKRQAGTVGVTDLLVLVLIADAAQNAMAGGYSSITEGLLLVATIVFWNYALEWLGYKFEWFERLLHPAPLPLIKNGRMQRKNMRHELITEDELLTHLREEGVEDIKEVKEAYLEGDGKISVIARGKKKKS